MARGTQKPPAPSLDLGLKPASRDQLALFAKALSGDLLFVVSPALYNHVATEAAWTKTVFIELQTAAGKVHTWFNKAIATGVSVADTSTAGTATIPSTTLTFVEGVASVVVSGDAASWLNGEAVTLTIAQATILGYTASQKTCVISITTAATSAQSVSQSLSPSPSPSLSPSISPSISPSASPSASPSLSPSPSPSLSPSFSPSASPSTSPSASPSLSPSISPSISPSESPSPSPSLSPSPSPSLSPSLSPSISPSISPSESPSLSPSVSPSASPSA